MQSETVTAPLYGRSRSVFHTRKLMCRVAWIHPLFMRPKSQLCNVHPCNYQCSEAKATSDTVGWVLHPVRPLVRRSGMDIGSTLTSRAKCICLLISHNISSSSAVRPFWFVGLYCLGSASEQTFFRIGQGQTASHQIWPSYRTSPLVWQKQRDVGAAHGNWQQRSNAALVSHKD